MANGCPFLAAFARKPACFVAALSGVEGAVEWVGFQNRIPFKSCHSERAETVGIAWTGLPVRFRRTSSNKQMNTIVVAAPVELQAQLGVTEKQLATEQQPQGHSQTTAYLLSLLPKLKARC